MSPTIHLLTPTYRPAGGVVKLMDYATHALAAGYAVSVSCPDAWHADLPLFQIERFRQELVAHDRVQFHTDRRLDVRGADFVLISLPSSFDAAVRSLPRGMSPERVIHLVQGVRHVNPAWLSGHATRLLAKPASRISVNKVIGSVIAPWLDPRAIHKVIPLGHDHGYFAKERTGPLSRPIRVAHTTWKSTVGDDVELLVDPTAFDFRAIRRQVGWDELRELYHWAEVFLCTPGPEEGFYMPGLEAMEAGCLVVTPDVGGNMAYCRPDENCLLVEYEDATSYAAALQRLSVAGDDAISRLRAAGYGTTHEFDLRKERAAFATYLEQLEERVTTYETRNTRTLG